MDTLRPSTMPSLTLYFDWQRYQGDYAKHGAIISNQVCYGYEGNTIGLHTKSALPLRVV
jgi:hypothetical protein